MGRDADAASSVVLDRAGGRPVELSAAVDPASLARTDDVRLARLCRRLLFVVQRTRPHRQAAVIADIDAVLAEARRRARPALLAPVLRAAVSARLVSVDDVAGVDPLLDEMTAHAREHALPRLLADAHVWRARRSMRVGSGGLALDDVATALALLAEPDAGLDGPDDGPDVDRAAVLTDLGLVLTHVGAHELAEEAFARAEPHLAAAGEDQQLITALNRVRLMLSWALRLERAGLPDRALDRFAAALGAADDAAPVWVPILGEGGEPGDECAVLGSAAAFAAPAASHVDRLRRLAEIANFPCDRFLVALALARCLEAAGRADQAVDVVVEQRARVAESGDRTEQLLLLAAARELARLQHVLDPSTATTAPVRDYVVALEDELWALRQSRIATIRTRAEHLRLSREHGVAAAAALSDPLTGLPNRRALDDVLAAALAADDGAPCSIALLDLDGFKDVNDRQSHAVGDEVLRTVTAALRSALRAGDTVARYGGDEFVVVLPATPLATARTALDRAVAAVAALPPTAGAGVTVSAGVVELVATDRGRGAEAVLARADAAMYRAKRRGGNQVRDG